MATEIKLPRLGQGMESGTIVRWLKSEGEPVAKGEPLYELDTDKVTQEVEADASGVLLRIAVPEGEVDVGHTIAVIGQEGEEVPEQEEAAPKAESPPEAPAPSPVSRDGEPRETVRIKASPLARRIARERGIDLASLRGTGPEGRIVAEDVERAAAAPASTAAPAASPAEAEVVPLTSLRRTIARRMTEAWQAPAFQISMSADMTRALAIRALDNAGIAWTESFVGGGVTAVVALGFLFLALNLAMVSGAININIDALRVVMALALLGNLLPQGNFDEAMRARQLNDMRADILRAADRAQSFQDFRRYVRELRQRKQAERDADERRRGQDTTRVVP